MTVSEYIRLRLKELSLTQGDLADRLGITKQNMNNKLSRDNFTSQELCKIAQILHFSVVLDTDTGHTVIDYPATNQKS